MNILMLGRWLPPPRRPVRGTREYQFARHLARRHKLTLAFIADNPDAAGAITALRGEFGDLEFASIPRGWKSLASAVRLVSGESCTLSYFRSEALRTRLADRLRRTRYDLVFVSSSSMIQYALDVSPTIPMVVDFGEVDSQWWVRQAARGSFPATRFFQTEAARLRAAEGTAARRATLCLAETREAAGIVQALGPGAPIGLIPTGVDVEGPGPVQSADQAPTVVLSVSLSGATELKDARDFYRAVIATARKRVPAARFLIASRDPIPGARAGRDPFGVEVMAPTDIRSLYHGHAVAIAPQHAGFELRASVLEPMAAGIPVITTQTVCDQLGAQAGRDLRVAATALDFERELVELLENSSLRGEAGAQGRVFAQANYSWEALTVRLDQLLAEVVRAAGDPTTTKPRPIAAILGG